MKNILIFPCGSEIGLEINRSLSNSKHFKIFGGNSVSDHGKYVYKNYISNIPFVDDLSFIDKINETIKRYKIDFIYPAHDSVVLKLAENQDKIKATVITSNIQTCQVCRSKSKTYKFFKNIIPVPIEYKIEDWFTFPVFLKPDIGQGSKGTFIANTREDLDFYLEKDPTLLILEYLPKKEYTIDCFTNKDGVLLFAEGRERVRINNGISVNSKQVKNPEFKKLANKINDTLSFRGAWFFQVKERENKELVLMEIAPRISGTMGLFRVYGVNFAQLSIFDRMGLDVEIIKNNLKIEVDRALISRFSIKEDYNTIYIDFDDTIIIEDKVNVNIISYLYQAKNEGKKIIILTKHEGDILKAIEECHISVTLFDGIVQLRKEGIKSYYINPNNSIFIDDSFEERKNVSDNLKIPVFGIDTIEALMKYKT
jgi:hypothetical protein